jgi:hypothetical protein
MHAAVDLWVHVKPKEYAGSAAFCPGPQRCLSPPAAAIRMPESKKVRITRPHLLQQTIELFFIQEPCFVALSGRFDQFTNLPQAQPECRYGARHRRSRIVARAWLPCRLPSNIMPEAPSSVVVPHLTHYLCTAQRNQTPRRMPHDVRARLRGLWVFTKVG